MSPESRQPDPSVQAAFELPQEQPPQIQLSLTDILTHLTTNAQAQVSVTAATRQAQGMDPQSVDELNRRLQNVTRLADELQAELAAIQILRPPDQGRPVVL
ncbi:lysyl-tRNA synthetase class I [Geodermatophilus bullaregiensis]|nr:lysyl-tRNA synthetase class I [Geodermatophilus bullaregiensis]